MRTSLIRPVTCSPRTGSVNTVRAARACFTHQSGMQALRLRLEGRLTDEGLRAYYAEHREDSTSTIIHDAEACEALRAECAAGPAQPPDVTPEEEARLERDAERLQDIHVRHQRYALLQVPVPASHAIAAGSVQLQDRSCQLCLVVAAAIMTVKILRGDQSSLP